MLSIQGEALGMGGKEKEETYIKHDLHLTAHLVMIRMEVFQASCCCKDCNPALTGDMLRGEVRKMTLISVGVQVVVATNTFPFCYYVSAS